MTKNDTFFKIRQQGMDYKGWALGVVPRGWAPGDGLQAGAAQGDWSRDEKHGCRPHVSGPHEVCLQGWA